MELTGKNLIGFKESAKGTKTFSSKNPATQQDTGVRFYGVTLDELNEAVEVALKAFEVYRLKSNEERAVFLETIAENILAIGDQLIKKCVEETALPEARITGERMRTINQLRLFASVVREGSWVDARIDPAMPERQPAPRPDIRQMHIPLGPVGVFGASNFPLAFSVAGGDTSSALAAGCPVIFKAHSLHPGTAELVAKAILKAARETNMPDGVFSLLHSTSHEIGMTLVGHPGIRAIGFTGSFKGGKTFFDIATRRETPIPVFAEMGSINPVFILPGALKQKNETIAKGLVASVTLGVGQFCTNPGLVVLEKSSDSEKLLQNMKSVNSEYPSEVMLSENMKSSYSGGIQNLLNSEGVEHLCCGAGDETGNKVKSQIFSVGYDTFKENHSLSDEVFGPSTLVVSTGEKNELIRLAENLEGHLTATIHGTEDDLREYEDLVRILERKVGRLIFNGFPTGVEVCHAMVHGGPYPATTAPQSTSVGTAAIKRFSRPVCYQDFPQSVLPDQLKDGNPLKIWRMKNGEMAKD